MISTSSTFSSKPTRSSEARQDPACPRPGSAACLRAGLSPPGWGGGAQYRQEAPQTKHFGRRKGKACGAANAHMLKHVFYTCLHAVKCENVKTLSSSQFKHSQINRPLTPTALQRQQTRELKTLLLGFISKVRSGEHAGVGVLFFFFFFFTY